jgi:hypothetical protein
MVSKTAGLEGKVAASMGREAVVDMVLSAGGLAAVFAGTAIFNALISWLHWR